MFEFDNSRPDAFLTEISLGYVALLEGMRWRENAEATPRGPYLRQLDITHYEPSPKDILSHWLKNTPAAIVHVTGARPYGHHHGSIDWQVSVNVHLFSRHASGRTEDQIVVDRSEGRTTLHDPGMHVIVQHVVEYLHGGRPTPYCHSSVFPSDMRRVGDGAQWAWWVYETEVQCRLAIDPDRDQARLDQAELVQRTPESGDVVAEQRRVF